jgi:hypothetical protein
VIPLRKYEDSGIVMEGHYQSARGITIPQNPEGGRTVPFQSSPEHQPSRQNRSGRGLIGNMNGLLMIRIVSWRRQGFTEGSRPEPEGQHECRHIAGEHLEGFRSFRRTSVCAVVGCNETPFAHNIVESLTAFFKCVITAGAPILLNRWTGDNKF